MRQVRPRAPDMAAWEEGLLGMDTEVLLALARNYVGAIRSPWDKRTVVSRLAAFAKRPETVEAMLDLFDSADVAIACTILLAGPLTDGELRALFRAEIKAFDLGVKIANLEDRLVLFRMREARVTRFAVNPLLNEALAGFLRDPRSILGGGSASRTSPYAPSAGQAQEALSPLVAALGLFSFVFHNPGAVKRDGSLSKKAQARLSAIVPEAVLFPERYSALLKSFVETGILTRSDGEGDFDADAEAFGVLLERHGGGLPFRLALGLSLPRGGSAGAVEDLASVVAEALESLPRGLGLPEAGLARWMGMATLGFDPAFDTDALVLALSSLGMIELRGGDFFLTRESGEEEDEGGVSRPQLVPDGAHLLRVLPEAGIQARWLAARIARPSRLGLVWELELDRDSIREAFASGLEAKEIVESLAKFSVRPLPQSLAFSIESWEKEFRSTRLFHGWVLVCDERRRTIVEGRPDISALVKEGLGPGVYLLEAGELEDFASTLAAAGIEVPPPIRPHAHPRSVLSSSPRSISAEEWQRNVSGTLGPRRSKISFDPSSIAEGDGAAPRRLDPEARLSRLRAALAERERSDDRAAERGRELADRIEARLVVDEAQLDRADVTPVRVEAGSLDYGGKTRLAERAIASPGDRLEIKYQLPGGDPETVVVRPVRLQKTDRGLVLEGEDLAAGTPVRVPLGAASMVRRLRATPFGDER